MKKWCLTCIIFICIVFSAYCTDSTVLRQVSVTHYPVERREEKIIVINFDDTGLLSSIDSEDLNDWQEKQRIEFPPIDLNLKVRVTHDKNIYDFYFQSTEHSWHHKMIPDKNCWKWFYEDDGTMILICTLYYSDDEMCITSDGKEEPINIKYENKKMTIDMGYDRKCVLDMSKPVPSFVTDIDYDDVSEISKKNGSYSFDTSFEFFYDAYSVENAPPFTDFSRVAFLIPVLSRIHPFFYPFVTGLINISETDTYHATSYLTEDKTTYEPEQLQKKDGLPWASANGKGIGEVINIKKMKHENPDELVIMNGYQDKNHPDYYEKNSRVKKLKITNAQTQKSKTITVKDTKDEQRFSLTELGSGSEYDFEILDVYEGNKYDDLCIQYLVVE